MFWYHWGYWTEGQHWLEEGLARADGAAPEIRATALHALGMLVEQQSQTERAMRLLDQSLALFRELGDSLGSLRVLNTLGGVASRQGHYHESAAYYQQALDFYRQLGDRERGAVVLHNLAKATRFQGGSGWHGSATRRRSHFIVSWGMRRSRRDTPRSRLLSLDEDRFVEAESRLEESLGASRELGLQPWIAYACWQLGRLHRKQEQLDRARTYLVESMTLARSLGDAFLVSIFWGDR
jgi:tetratricopeptide (TPR) repeat protein